MYILQTIIKKVVPYHVVCYLLFFIFLSREYFSSYHGIIYPERFLFKIPLCDFFKKEFYALIFLLLEEQLLNLNLYKGI